MHVHTVTYTHVRTYVVVFIRSVTEIDSLVMVFQIIGSTIICICTLIFATYMHVCVCHCWFLQIEFIRFMIVDHHLKMCASLTKHQKLIV